MTKSVKISNRLLPKGSKVLALSAWHRQQCEVIKLFGTIKFESDFNSKTERAKR